VKRLELSCLRDTKWIFRGRLMLESRKTMCMSQLWWNKNNINFQMSKLRGKCRGLEIHSKKMKRFTPLIVKINLMSNDKVNLTRPPIRTIYKSWQTTRWKLLRLLTRIVKSKLFRTWLSRQLTFRKPLKVSQCLRIGMQRPLTKSRTKPTKWSLSEIKIWTATWSKTWVIHIIV